MIFTSHLFPELYNFAVVVESKSSWRGGVVVRSLALRSEGLPLRQASNLAKNGYGTGNLMLTVTLRLTSIPSTGKQKYSLLPHATESERGRGDVSTVWGLGTGVPTSFSDWLRIF